MRREKLAWKITFTEQIFVFAILEHLTMVASPGIVFEIASNCARMAAWLSPAVFVAMASSEVLDLIFAVWSDD